MKNLIQLIVVDWRSRTVSFYREDDYHPRTYPITRERDDLISYLVRVTDYASYKIRYA